MNPSIARYFVLFVVTNLFSHFALSQAVTRRNFVTGMSACIALLGSPSRTEAKYVWPVDPSLDTNRMGLESYGMSVRDLLITNGFASQVNAEKVRWEVQRLIWNQLQEQRDVRIAIALGDNQYLYLNPHFLVDVAGHQVRSIKYVSQEGDSRTLPYVIRYQPPTDDTVIVISPSV